jgi:hypothetical protein
MQTVGNMIRQLEGLLGTRDATEKNQDFIRKVVELTQHGKKTSVLTPAQTSYVESLWKQHYG